MNKMKCYDDNDKYSRFDTNSECRIVVHWETSLFSNPNTNGHVCLTLHAYTIANISYHILLYITIANVLYIINTYLYEHTLQLYDCYSQCLLMVLLSQHYLENIIYINTRKSNIVSFSLMCIEEFKYIMDTFINCSFSIECIVNKVISERNKEDKYNYIYLKRMNI